MTAWSDGYIVDQLYTRKYFAQLSPQRIGFAVLDAGFAPPPTRDFTYCELGFGRGQSLVFNAAAHPSSQFYGNDFMPAQVAEAQRFADTVGVENLVLSDDSFEQYLERDLPKFDYIVLHGIYSWVDEHNRGILDAFLMKNLKVGGVVYISYNAMPGWAALMPLRELMLAYVGNDADLSDARIRAAIEYVKEFAAVKPSGFWPSPVLNSVLDGLQDRDIAYVRHEYFHKSLKAFYFHEVAERLSSVKLEFVSKSSRGIRLSELKVPERLHELVDLDTDPLRREGLPDFATGAIFRSDIFARGAVPLRTSERTDLIGALSFALVAPAAHIIKHFKAHKVAENLPVACLQEVVNALDKGNKKVSELKAMVSKKHSGEVVDRVLGLLISDRYIATISGEDSENHCAALNRQIMHEAEQNTDEARNSLLSHRIGIGVRVSWLELMFVLAETTGEDPLKFVRSRISRSPALMAGDGKSLTQGREGQQKLQGLYDGFCSGQKSRLRELGIL